MENSNSAIHTPFEEKIIAALRSVFDPEIPANIYDLGLIYNLKIDEGTNDVYILMTLTTPNCPVAEDLPIEIHDKIRAVEGVKECNVTLTFEPAWDKSMISDTGLLELGML